MSKNVKIIVSIACFVLAAGILYFTTFSGGGSSGGGATAGDGKIWFKCVNPDCNQAYSLTPDEFANAQGDNPMMRPGQQQAFTCAKCSQQSAYMAQQCKKCKEVFIMQMEVPGQDNQDYPDKCPKCGYSAIEQMVKEQK